MLEKNDVTCISHKCRVVYMCAETVRGARDLRLIPEHYGKVSRGGIHVEVVMKIQMLRKDKSNK